MKRHRATVRGGRKRAFKSDAAYRLHLRGAAEEAGPDGPSTRRSVYYGSKCYKPAAERRPASGGRVHS
jgi:hypothetical protein